MKRTHENYLRWKLGQYAERHAPNIVMLQPGDSSVCDLEQDEHAVAVITPLQGELPLLVTDIRLIRGGRTLLRHADIRTFHWIDRDRPTAIKLKHTHFDKLILDVSDGREIILNGLGQAVFPLMNFYKSKLFILSGAAHDPSL